MNDGIAAAQQIQRHCAIREVSFDNFGVIPEPRRHSPLITRQHHDPAAPGDEVLRRVASDKTGSPREEHAFTQRRSLHFNSSHRGHVGRNSGADT